MPRAIRICPACGHTSPATQYTCLSCNRSLSGTIPVEVSGRAAMDDIPRAPTAGPKSHRSWTYKVVEFMIGMALAVLLGVGLTFILKSESLLAEHVIEAFVAVIILFVAADRSRWVGSRGIRHLVARAAGAGLVALAVLQASQWVNL